MDRPGITAGCRQRCPPGGPTESAPGGVFELYSIAREIRHLPTCEHSEKHIVDSFGPSALECFHQALTLLHTRLFFFDWASSEIEHGKRVLNSVPSTAI
jgi:hypothetical protein